MNGKLQFCVPKRLSSWKQVIFYDQKIVYSIKRKHSKIQSVKRSFRNSRISGDTQHAILLFLMESSIWHAFCNSTVPGAVGFVVFSTIILRVSLTLSAAVNAAFC